MLVDVFQGSDGISNLTVKKDTLPFLKILFQEAPFLFDRRYILVECLFSSLHV